MAFEIRARIPGSPQPIVVPIADAEAPMHFLYTKVSELANISEDELKLMIGFPPREVPMEKRDSSIGSLLKKNEVIMVQKGESRLKQGTTEGGKYIPPVNERTVFARREMPGDNSCFFHTVAYVLEGKATGKEEANKMRLKAAEFVHNNPQIFNAALLGMPSGDYVKWLLKTDSWGGELELLVFSLMYQTEIVAIDLQSLRLEHMGQEKGYTTRVFMVYTGNHYDAIAAPPPVAGASQRDDQVIFSSRDQLCFDQAVKWIKYELAKKK